MPGSISKSKLSESDVFGLMTSSVNFTKTGSSRKIANLSIDSKSIAMKKGQGTLRVDPFTAFYAEHLRNFEELHPGVHHHLLDASGSDLGLELIKDDVMHHEV